jgi:hypothetical protein
MYVICKKLDKVNIRPIGEHSPNLVTLFSIYVWSREKYSIPIVRQQKDEILLVFVPMASCGYLDRIRLLRLFSWPM